MFWQFSRLRKEVELSRTRLLRCSTWILAEFCLAMKSAAFRRRQLSSKSILDQWLKLVNESLINLKVAYANLSKTVMCFDSPLISLVNLFKTNNETALCVLFCKKSVRKKFHNQNGKQKRISYLRKKGLMHSSVTSLAWK